MANFQLAQWDILCSTALHHTTAIRSKHEGENWVGVLKQFLNL